MTADTPTEKIKFISEKEMKTKKKNVKGFGVLLQYIQFYFKK